MEHARQPTGWYLNALRLTAAEQESAARALATRDRRAIADLAAETLRRATEMTSATEQLLYAAGWSPSQVSLFMIGDRDEPE